MPQRGKTSQPRVRTKSATLGHALQVPPKNNSRERSDSEVTGVGSTHLKPTYFTIQT